MKNFIKISALVLALMLVFCGCRNDVTLTSKEDGTTEFVYSDETYSKETTSQADSDDETDSGKSEKAEHSFVKFTMENGGELVIELYPEYAPETVENFKKLVGEGFYDGLTFHRVYEGFMAQGGDPEGTGMGGSKETIKGEFLSNGFKDNKLSHTRGVVSMARSTHPDSASSQFFICYDNATFLDGDYAAFGVVVDGMDVVDGFLDTEREFNGETDAYGRKVLTKPVTPIVIEKAEVVTNG